MMKKTTRERVSVSFSKLDLNFDEEEEKKQLKNDLQLQENFLLHLV